MHNWKQLVRERLAPLQLEATRELHLIEEIAQHLEDRYRETLSGGATEEDAYQRALLELRDMYPMRNVARPDLDPSKPANFLEDLWRDLRYAIRTLRKSPMFVLVIVFTLALGIGANTTVFTVINTLILNPLPVQDADGLAAIGVNEAKSKALIPISYSDLKDYQSRNGTFSELAGYTSVRLVTWQAEASSQRMFTELVTGNYFTALGLKPALGRFFLPEEDSTPGAHAVAVLSYGTWQMHFGSSPDVIGKTVRLNNIAFTIIGIAPPRFIGMNAIFGPDLWIPAAMAERTLPNELQAALSDRNKVAFLGVGRLKPGLSRSQAQANLATIAADLAREYPTTNEGHVAAVLPVRDVLFGAGNASSKSILFGSVILLVVVGIVLLIACSNVANLLLARSSARRQEMSVRLAMGASRERLIRQLLTESVLLGAISGVLGFFIGFAGLKVLFGTLPAAANFATPKFDAIVFLFALVISLATGFLFGAIPAFQASRAAIIDTLKEARTTGRRFTLANALLVGQVAFSFLLLVTAALFLRSIGRAYQMDPGFQTANLAVFMTNPGQTGYGKPQTKAFYKDVHERVARIPGVRSVSWSSNMPLWGRVATGLQVEGREQRSRAEKVTTILNTIGPDFFETSGVTLNRGREFSATDQETSTPVAIINEKMAHDYWPDGDALGKRIQLPGEKQMRQIVGIARTANYSTWGEPPQFCVYVPLEQNYSDAMILYVRTHGAPQSILIPVQQEVRAAAPQVLATGIRTGSEIVEGGLFQARMGVALLTVFGLLALVLASIGLYGIMAYSVNQRKREIGLRMALGAAQASVLRLILKQGMSLVLIGVSIGFAAALVTGRLLSRMLFGVNSNDPASVAGAALVLLTVALIACYLPARWASHVDPLVALRDS